LIIELFLFIFFFFSSIILTTFFIIPTISMSFFIFSMRFSFFVMFLMFFVRIFRSRTMFPLVSLAIGSTATM
jgi:hypothetical protein